MKTFEQVLADVKRTSPDVDDDEAQDIAHDWMRELAEEAEQREDTPSIEDTMPEEVLALRNEIRESPEDPPSAELDTQDAHDREIFEGYGYQLTHGDAGWEMDMLIGDVTWWATVEWDEAEQGYSVSFTPCKYEDARSGQIHDLPGYYATADAAHNAAMTELANRYEATNAANADTKKKVDAYPKLIAALRTARADLRSLHHMSGAGHITTLLKELGEADHADTEKNLGAEPWRAPKLAEGDELLYCEPGRILYRTPERKPGTGTDSRSHWFRVVKNGGRHSLLVKHGAGEERVNLGYDYRNFPAILDPLDSDARYWLLWIILEVHKTATSHARQDTAYRYQRAFVEGRLRKRKERGGSSVKVWIELAKAEATCSSAP